MMASARMLGVCKYLKCQIVWNGLVNRETQISLLLRTLISAFIRLFKLFIFRGMCARETEVLMKTDQDVLATG